MKKVILYLLTMIFALSTATALAAEPADAPVSMRERMEKIRVESDPVYQAEKAKRMENMPKVAVLYVNNAETTYNDEVDGVVLGNLEKCINDDKYIYINGEPYIEKLNKVGIVDITTAERADIVDAFEGEDVDYVVFIEVQPFIARDKVTFFTVGAEFYFHSCGYSVFGVAERADHCAARRLLSLFNRRFQFLEITRDREHIPVVAFRKEIIAQVDVIIISVLQFVVTADIRYR